MESMRVRANAKHRIESAALPTIVGRKLFEEQLAKLRVSEKEHAH